MINLLAPMQSTGFIISDEQPVTLTNDTDIWNHIKKAINLHGVTTHVFQTERSRL